MKEEEAYPSKTPRTVEELKRLLVRAGELEHILMAAYLFTAYTLKQDASEGGFSESRALRETQLQAVKSWRGKIVGVAVQEMLHLALVGNMLSAIGGTPDFGRQGLSFPITPHTLKKFFGYDGRAWLGLWPFSELTIERYIWFEAFEHEEFPGPPFDEAIPAFAGPSFLAGLEDLEVSNLVELYEAIARGFVFLNRRLGPERLFPPERRIFQVTDEEVTGLFNFPPATVMEGGQVKNRPLLIPVTDLGSALAAINTIIVQGEGDVEEWQQFIESLPVAPEVKRFPTIHSPSHHFTFRSILLGEPAVSATNPRQARPRLPGYYELRLEHPDFDPVRAVPENPLVDDPCGSDAICRRHIHLIEDPFTKEVARFFDDLYDTMISMLALGYAHPGSRDEESVHEYEKATLIQAAIRSMVYLIGPLANALTQLPGEAGESWFAGPGFVDKGGHRDWDELEESLRDLANRAHLLAAEAPERELWMSPIYLGIPKQGHEYPQETIRDVLCKRLAADLLFMADRLQRVEGHAPNPEFEVHVCQGLNSCAGQDITGTAKIAGGGVCATADPHVCAGQNTCRGQGGCGFSPDGSWALQNHPGENNYAGQVKDEDGFYQFNPQADSACGSPILPSLTNTFGLNTPEEAQRGGADELFETTNGHIWEFARSLFEERMRARGIPFDEDFDLIDRYRNLCPPNKSS